MQAGLQAVLHRFGAHRSLVTPVWLDSWGARCSDKFSDKKLNLIEQSSLAQLAL